MAEILKNNVTFDFGDKVWSTNETINSYPWALVGVEGTATLTGDKGGIDTYSNLGKDDLDAKTDCSYCLTVGDMKLHRLKEDGKIERTTFANAGEGIKGNLTIKGGTYMGTFDVLYVTNGVCTIEDGIFFSQPDSSQSSKSDAERVKYGPYRNFMLNLYDSFGKRGDAKIIVKGGSFIGFDPADNYAEGDGTNFVAVGYKSVENGEYTYMIKDKNRTDNGTLTTVKVYTVVPDDDSDSDNREGIKGTVIE